MARFECAAQRFTALQEYGAGLALLNSCKYGHAVRGKVGVHSAHSFRILCCSRYDTLVYAAVSDGAVYVHVTAACIESPGRAS